MNTHNIPSSLKKRALKRVIKVMFLDKKPGDTLKKHSPRDNCPGSLEAGCVRGRNAFELKRGLGRRDAFELKRSPKTGFIMGRNAFELKRGEEMRQACLEAMAAFRVEARGEASEVASACDFETVHQVGAEKQACLEYVDDVRAGVPAEKGEIVTPHMGAYFAMMKKKKAMPSGPVLGPDFTPFRPTPDGDMSG